MGVATTPVPQAVAALAGLWTGVAQGQAHLGDWLAGTVGGSNKSLPLPREMATLAHLGQDQRLTNTQVRTNA